MEKQIMIYNPTTCHKVCLWNDNLSEHDLLAYIDGGLTLEDTKQIEKILFAKDNDFYLDILANLKQRYIEHQGNIQAVLNELDAEVAQIPFFQTPAPIDEKPKLLKKKKKIEKKLKEIEEKIDAQNSFINRKTDNEECLNFIEQKAFEQKTLKSDDKFFINLPLSALSKFFGKWIP